MSETTNAPAPPQGPNRPPVAAQGGENAASDSQPDSSDKPARGKKNAADGDGAGAAESARQDQAASADADTETLERPRLRPGDIGYAPPARVAMPAGEVLSAGHYDWNPGRSTTDIRGSVPLAVPVATVPSLAANPGMMKPSTLSAPEANARLTQMIGELTAWVQDFPHRAQGKAAVVVQFFRDLEAKAQTRATAQELGRTVEPDPNDKAEFTPPPEYFALRHAAEQILVVQRIYAGALADHGILLSPDDQTSVDRIVAEFATLANGPKTAEQA